MARQNTQSTGADDRALSQLIQPVRRELRLASGWSVVSALMWPVQAGFVAHGLAGLLAGAPALWPTVSGFITFGLLRALISFRAEGLSFAAATRVVSEARAGIVEREAQATDGMATDGMATDGMATDGMATDGMAAGGMAAGGLAALAGEKLDLIVPYITRYAPARARVTVLPLVILALAFWNSWAVGIVFLMTGPMIPVFMALVGLAAKEASQRQMAEIGTLNDLLVERLSALIDIRLLGAGEQVATGFAAGAERLRAQTMAVLRVAFLSSAVLELFSAIGVAMVAVYVGFDLLGMLNFGSYGTALAPAAGIFLLLLAPEYYQPLRDLSAAWHDKAAALAVAGELAVWQAKGEPALLGTGAGAQRLAGKAHITLRGVSVRRGAQLIQYPNFDVAAGETVALVGSSGAGKTTLLRLLAGTLVPEQGQITVAGVGLSEAVADHWRARLGWMPQSPHFLNDSLSYNVTFARGADASAALRMAAVADVVASLPLGAATRLGETGGGLSGGEARRLTLARALHAAPDVLLADEPTADLDGQTAEQVVGGLMALAATGCTLIVATHDAALAARMGRIIRIGEP